MSDIVETVPPALDGERIDRVVAAITDLSRTVVATMVKNGNVTLAGKPAKAVSVKVVEGQTIEITLPRAGDNAPGAEAGVEFGVLYEDEHLLVVDKPAGLVVHPGAGNDTGTLVHGLLQRFPDIGFNQPGDPQRPGIVHRLDAGTSGLLAVARTKAAYEQLVSDMKARSIERRYLALCWGNLQPDTGMIDAPIGRSQNDRTKMAVSARGRIARTNYEVVQRLDYPSLSLVAAQLETGRTHQIRVHLAALKHPIVGDGRYGGVRQGLQMTRPFLHARSLRLGHPITGHEIFVQSKLPEDLQKVIKKLGFPAVD